MVCSMCKCVDVSSAHGSFKVHGSNSETHMLPDEADRRGTGMIDIYLLMRQRSGLSKMSKSVPQNKLEDLTVIGIDGECQYLITIP